MGLFKNEAVAKDSPFRTGALKTETDVMEIVFEWVHWYNTSASIPPSGTRRPRNSSRHTMLEKSARYPTTPPTNRRHDSRDGSVPWLRSFRAERILASVMMRLRPPTRPCSRAACSPACVRSTMLHRDVSRTPRSSPGSWFRPETLSRGRPRVPSGCACWWPEEGASHLLLVPGSTPRILASGFVKRPRMRNQCST